MSGSRSHTLSRIGRRPAAVGARSVGIAQATVTLQPESRPGGMSPLARSVARTGARRSLEAELRSIALDLLGPFESEELPTACAAWVDMATKTAVTTVCDRSLSALIAALESLLIGAPPDIALRLDEARARHDAGIL